MAKPAAKIQTQAPEYQELGAVDFVCDITEYDKNGDPEIKTRYMRYDFKKIKSRQAEPALAIKQFHSDQENMLPSDVSAILDSGGHKWKTQILKYLLMPMTPMEKKTPKPAKGKHYTNLLEGKWKEEDIAEYEFFLEELPADTHALQMEVITDFFIRLGEQALLFGRQRRLKEEKMARIFSQLSQSKPIIPQ
jgi:hypothetical protein